MKKIKFAKEEDRDQKTLAKQYKRLEIFIIIFMAIAICLGTFYFNVICFGSDCEYKTPQPLIIINPSKTSTNAEEKDNSVNSAEASSYSYDDIYAVYESESNGNKAYWLTLHKDGTFEYSDETKVIKGNYILIDKKVQLNYESESSIGVNKEITGMKELSIINKTKLYDNDNSLNLNRTNIPTESGQ